MTGSSRLFPTLSPHRAAFAGVVVVTVLFLGVLYFVLLRGYHDSQREDATDLWQDKVVLAGQFITESMLRNDYQDVEQFLALWPRNQPRIAFLRATAVNGFVVHDYRRLGRAVDPIPLVHVVTYAGEPLLTIEAEVDLGYLAESLRARTVMLLLSYAAFVVLLAGLTWLAVRHFALLPLERSRSALAQSERHYRELVEGLPNAICEHRDGRILFANRAATALFGCASAEDLVGRPIDALIQAEDEYALAAPALAGRRHPLRLMPVEGRALRQGGDPIPVDILSMPAPVPDDPGGGVGTVLTILRDITIYKTTEAALIRARDQAETSSRAKSEFLANMSHELRTPLNAIIGFSEIIRTEMFGPPGNDTYANYVASINDSGRHLLGIINDILDMSKVEVGRMDLIEEVVDLPSTVEAAVRFLRERAEDGGVAIRIEIGKVPRIKAERRRVLQIVLNLLTNAVKFTNPGGCIEIAARLGADGWVELSVEDSGIGMTPSEIETALSPFGQIDSGLARRHDGTGLGLPLVQSFTELHGGTLAVISEPGVGTCVTVRFPPSRVIGEDETAAQAPTV